MTRSGNVSSSSSTSPIWETGSFSISLLKTATHTSTESLSGNSLISFRYTNESLRELARELKSKPKKSKSRSNSNAGTLKKQKLLKV